MVRALDQFVRLNPIAMLLTAKLMLDMVATLSASVMARK